MSTVILSLLAAVVLAGLGLLIARTTRPLFHFEESHWLLIIICVILTTFSLFIAFQSHRYVRIIDQGIEKLSLYNGILNLFIDFNMEDSLLDQNSGSELQSFQTRQKTKINIIIGIATALPIALNLLTWFVILKGANKPNRRKQRRDYADKQDYNSIDTF